VDFQLKDLLAFAGGSGFAGVVALWLLYREHHKESEVVKEMRRGNDLLRALIASVVARHGDGDRG
jgi:hypothetical protein